MSSPSYPRTAPQTVEDQQGLGAEASGDLRSTSAPNNNTNAAFNSARTAENQEIPGSPDSSSNDDSSSNLSDLDSATELQRPGDGNYFDHFSLSQCSPLICGVNFFLRWWPFFYSFIIFWSRSSRIP